jgi:uncharacterized protein
MKATLFLTMACNLRCDYCYIRKQNIPMNRATLVKAVDFAFCTAGPNERVDIGLFGGEPLLNWPLAQEAVALIEQRAEDRRHVIRLSLVTNGTLMNDEILQYLLDHHIILQVSCDGAPHVQDKHRRYADGKPSSAIVEANLSAALKALPAVLVNVVYSPDTYSYLPESIEYFTSLGLRQIILNPDYSAAWGSADIAGLENTYGRIAELYLSCYEVKSPLFISLIDEKIAVILRGGYGPSERCHMGYGEFAFSPQGFVFPCERLVGDGERNRHCIGHLDQPDNLQRGHCQAKGNGCKNTECQLCGVADYCMNWCGCSNFFASGDYRRPSPFLCTSERLAINAAFNVLKQVEEDNQLIFINHYAGLPMVNSSV